jgi:hypothetical protein
MNSEHESPARDAGFRHWLTRARWRRRGNWLWPLFLVLTIADAVIGHELPLAGDHTSLFGAAIFAMFVNLLVVVLLTRPLSALVRRIRTDLPTIIARDYAGRALLVALAALLLAVGLLHRPAVLAREHAISDAIARAQAYIGAHAPAAFQRDLMYVSTFTIQAGRIYRVCVPGEQGTDYYCVVVREDAPFPQGVSYAGAESNAVLDQGAW